MSGDNAIGALIEKAGPECQVGYCTAAVAGIIADRLIGSLADQDTAIVKYLLDDVRVLKTRRMLKTSELLDMRRRTEAALRLTVTVNRFGFCDNESLLFIGPIQIILKSAGLLDITSQVVASVVELVDDSPRPVIKLDEVNGEEAWSRSTAVTEEDVYTVLTASQEKAIEDSEAEIEISEFVSIVRIVAGVLRGKKGKEQ